MWFGYDSSLPPVETSETGLPGQQSFLSTAADSLTCPLEKTPTSLFTEAEAGYCQIIMSSETLFIFNVCYSDFIK